MGTYNSPRRLGKYELQAMLGRGGMAEVWKARDSQLGRYVAIKILHTDLQNDPDFMKRFVREARVIASLHQPNIIKIHDFQISMPPESESPIAYMVMDYVEGETLADFICTTSKMGNFPPATNILHLFTSMSKAIDYAHQYGMIHRDIKPANILLDRRLSKDYPATRNLMGEPILTDFGIVKLLGASSATLSGSWMGTPLYISPEQAQGKSGNELSDIYSLGVILYEICTGVRPFSGDTTISIIMQHINAIPTPPDLINPNISPALREVIQRSLAKDPLARFPSASTMAEALAQALQISPSVNLHSSPPLADSTSGLTYKSSLLPNLLSAVTSSSSSSTVLPTSQSLRKDLISPSPPTDTIRMEGDATLHKQGFSLKSPRITPTDNFSEVSQFTNAAQNKPGRRRRGVFIVVVAMLIMALVGSGSGALYLFTHPHQDSPTMVNQIVGNAFFISSVQLNKGTTQSLNNKLQISLSNIPNPPLGKSYYAWLLSDKKQSPMIPLLIGRLPINSGSVNFLYPGDPQQTDLLATFSRLLITEEDQKSRPGNPSTDQSTWRYLAELPQEPTATGIALDFLRFLLSEDPLLQKLGIHGGLNLQLYRNMQQVVEWADRASNSQDKALIRLEVISILDYLDGESYVQKDVPPGTPLMVNRTFSQVGIIDIELSQLIPGYLVRISDRLSSITYSSGVTLANQINLALSSNVQMWLDQARQDAKHLVNLSDTQLLQPSSKLIMIDMQTQVHNAFDPATGQKQKGISQLYTDIQHLATFDITVYKP